MILEMGCLAYQDGDSRAEMRQMTQVSAGSGRHHLSVALIDLTSSGGGHHDLHVDSFGLSVGDVSVGLPLSCTADTVLLRYLELVDLCDVRGVESVDVETHVPVLAGAVSLAPETVRQRLRQLSA